MYGSVGPGELFVIAVIGLFCLIPLAVIIWIGSALRTIRAGQEALLAKLDALERALPRPSPNASRSEG